MQFSPVETSASGKFLHVNDSPNYSKGNQNLPNSHVSAQKIAASFLGVIKQLPCFFFTPDSPFPKGSNGQWALCFVATCIQDSCSSRLPSLSHVSSFLNCYLLSELWSPYSKLHTALIEYSLSHVTVLIFSVVCIALLHTMYIYLRLIYVLHCLTPPVLFWQMFKNWLHGAGWDVVNALMFSTCLWCKYSHYGQLQGGCV